MTRNAPSTAGLGEVRSSHTLAYAFEQLVELEAEYQRLRGKRRMYAVLSVLSLVAAVALSLTLAARLPGLQVFSQPPERWEYRMGPAALLPGFLVAFSTYLLLHSWKKGTIQPQVRRYNRRLRFCNEVGLWDRAAYEGVSVSGSDRQSLQAGRVRFGYLPEE